MKILIIDKFFQPRDPAQTDMYKAISSEHKVIFSSNAMKDVMAGNYDLLYLGIYHQSMNIELAQLLFYNKKPVIIDQADNEEFILRNKIRRSANIKFVLSRYLPNDNFQTYCINSGLPYAWLPWYVSPDRFHTTTQKLYDISFICSMYGNRIEIADNIKGYCALSNSKSSKVGEVFGADYVDILAKSYMVYVECGRKCMTQKYIEASICDCVLVGDQPIYPENELKVYQNIPENYTNLKGNREYILETYANKGWFMERFNDLLK